MTTWYARPAARDWHCDAPPPDPIAFHRSLPGYRPTPLTELPSLAAELGVGRVFVKDESARLELAAFKVLGASWAVNRALGGTTATLTDLRAAVMTGPPRRLVTATDGNHGRAIAYMATLLGLSAQVFVPEVINAEAVAAIEAEGATVVTVPSSYDDTVRHAAAVADGDPEAALVQDTAWLGYEEIPQWIVDGYSTLFREIDTQLAEAGSDRLDLLAVPVGVGSLAQAAVAYHRSGTRPVPALLAVEPDTAACVTESLRERRPSTVDTANTNMAGLNCGTPSSIAWPYLRDGLDLSITVTDVEATSASHDLGGLAVSSGPCGASTLAAVRALVREPGGERRRSEAGLGPDATVVLLSTEGA